MNKKIWLLVFIILLLPISCSEDKVNTKTILKDSNSKVLHFIREMNPELLQTMDKISVEITSADKKIKQLHELNEMYPNQTDIIHKALEQWQELRKNLSVTLPNIYKQVEATYVAYKIDEIQGKKKFSIISKELLIEANALLANAETTKSILEKELLSE